jgi:hypothetical protein
MNRTICGAMGPRWPIVRSLRKRVPGIALQVGSGTKMDVQPVHLTPVRLHNLILPFLLIPLGVLGACSRGRIPSSNSSDPPKLPAPMVSVRPPVALTPEKTDDFLVWVATVPISQKEIIRQHIAAAAADSRVLDALTVRLLKFPVTDYGRHLMILSTLGEIRSPRAIGSLKQFIWYDKEMFAGDATGASTGVKTSYFSPTRALQSRAVEMLAYIHNEEALAATLEVAAKHPGEEVRIAAINAYLFNQGDSEKAKAELSQHLREGDRKFIGLPRRTSDMNLREFEENVRAYYEKYPIERPPSPLFAEKGKLPTEAAKPVPRGVE